MRRFLPSAVILSVLGHALLLGVGAPRARPAALLTPARAGLAAPARAALARVDITEARRALVEKARADKDRGALLLGRFLIEGNRLDAEEAGQRFDAAEALARYEERLKDLVEALRDGEPLTLAVPRLFGDLRYYGQPGGRMGDALLDGGGSCEQVAQLIVASMHDAGKPAEAALRFYGQPMPDGVTHLAPVAVEGDLEQDLMTGKPALRKGSRIAAADLVEVYARAHGLAPALPRDARAEGKRGGRGAGEGEGDGSGPSSTPSTSSTKTTLAAGFPPNADRYPGSLPLYSARAVRGPEEAGDEPEDPAFASEQARQCAYVVRMAALTPLTIDVERRAGPIQIEAVRVPKPLRLEREAQVLRAAEDLADNPASDDADRLMSWACLASLGDMAAVDFTLAGEARLANAAIEAARRGKDAGKAKLAAIAWSSDQGARLAQRLGVDYGGRNFLLLFLEGGGDVVFELVRRAPREDWGRVSSMAALVLFPPTRARALAAIEPWSLRDRVDVMHEVFHAHDHLRPWAPNYDLDLPPGAGAEAARFTAAYAVFRRLAFRLWEARLDPGETLEALAREARARGLDATWEAAMLDYYARNTLGLAAQRPSGFEVVPALAAAARKNAHPSLDPLRRQLALLEAGGRLDPRTLADAFRQ
ncbi:MAG: hypothetical protein U0359_18200 [Byssovorax sp.]